MSELAVAELEVISSGKMMQGDLFDGYAKLQHGALVFKANMPLEAWIKGTEGLLEATKSGLYLLGQALVFGKKVYGEEYAQVMDATRYSVKTAQNAQWVVESVKEWHPNLSFSHHEKVAMLSPEAQVELLEEAEREGLTVSKLNKIVKERYPSKCASKPKAKKDFPEIESHDDAMEASNRAIAYFEAVIVNSERWSDQRKEEMRGLYKAFRRMAEKL